ncbi:MAG: glycosyltransferase, partial [Elusimicrobiota bacterium]
LTNKFLSNIADKIAISFPGWNAKKTILTGNPVRPEIKGISKHEGIDKINAMNGDFSLREEIFTILVFGGSQGSSTVNTGIASCLERMEPLRNEFQLIHISGEKDFIWLKKIYEVKKYNAVVFPYIHSMGFAYACADLVICRSGAMTVAELIALKKPAILIPYRYSTNAHQEYNARFLQERGAAILIREEEFECDRIINTLTNIIKNPSQLSSMKKVLSEIEIEDSGKKLAKIITDLLY